jgi:hypothetical protein
LSLVGSPNLVVVLALLSFFIIVCHTIRIGRMSLCQLSSMEDDTSVDQSAIDECSVSPPLASCQHICSIGIINLRSNDCSKEVQQIFVSTTDDIQQPHEFDKEGDCSKDTEDDLHCEHRCGGQILLVKSDDLEDDHA